MRQAAKYLLRNSIDSNCGVWGGAKKGAEKSYDGGQIRVLAFSCWASFAPENLTTLACRLSMEKQFTLSMISHTQNSIFQKPVCIPSIPLIHTTHHLFFYSTFLSTWAKAALFPLIAAWAPGSCAWSNFGPRGPVSVEYTMRAPTYWPLNNQPRPLQQSSRQNTSRKNLSEEQVIHCEEDNDLVISNKCGPTFQPPHSW